MKYMLMFVSDDSNWDPSKPEIQAAYRRIGEWFETHTKSGKITAIWPRFTFNFRRRTRRVRSAEYVYSHQERE